MLALLTPAFAMRLDTSDAGNDPAGVSSRHAFDLLAQGFGPGFNGPVALVAELSRPIRRPPCRRSGPRCAPPVTSSRSPRRGSRRRDLAVMQVYPDSAPQASATTNLVNHLRQTCCRRLSIGPGSGPGRGVHRRRDRLLPRTREQAAAVYRDRSAPLVAAAARDLPLASDPGAGRDHEPAEHRRCARRDRRGLPMGMARQRARHPERPNRTMDTGADVRGRVRALDGLRGVPDLARARGMGTPPRRIRRRGRRDRIHRPRNQSRRRDHGVRLPVIHGRRPATLKEFGFGLATAVFLDALVVRCVLLPAVLELLGPVTWRLPRWLDARLPHINIEGAARACRLSPKDWAWTKPQSSSRQKQRPVRCRPHAHD